MSISPFLIVFLATFLMGVVVIFTERWHGHFSLDGMDGVQKHHEEPTPRIGGLAIAAGLATAWLMTTAEAHQIVKVILLAGMPALLFGLAEDVTKEVGVLPRLLATMASGALAWYMTGVAMQNTGFPPLDMALQYLPLAVVFTAFAVGGVANSINIIDGFNGLASGCAAIMLAALGVMSLNAGDASFAQVCFLATCCALGFAAVNWPFGKIFLGDGGAYLLGFVLAWLAVLLPMRNVGINAWATILVCAYPVIEVGSSVLRRRKRDGHHPGQPDNVHMHHLVNRRIIRKFLPSMSRAMQNGMTSPICWILTALPAAWAIYFAKNTPMLVLGFCLEVVMYMALYARLSQFRWCITAVTLNKISPAKGLQAKLPL
jgi:UDP-N-acetylmuramyl pentapeptide phosphotransferase/UDP-N-acetylglucosamine-1-phosphate transferase